MNVFSIFNTGMSIIFIFLSLRKSQDKVARFICDAVTYMYVTALLVVMTYRYLFDPSNENVFILLTMLLLTYIVVFVITCYIKKVITKKYIKRSENYKVSSLTIIISVSGVLCDIFADANISQSTAKMIVEIGCMIFSIFFGIMGGISLLKIFFYNRVKNKL